MRSCERCHTPYKTRIEFCGLDGARVVESANDPLVGTSFDRYRVTERLGGGGMAVVYRAQHDVIEREVAIKILFGELAADREFAERFRREANAASRIKHPNVVEIYDFGETPAGMSFLIMELLRGETLSDAIHWTGPFSPRRAAGVLRQLASGLAAAHAMSFIHRDLKPGNVMLGAGTIPGSPVEVAKILDFGLVLIESDDDSARLTRTGQTLGTPHYMAPEQFAGGIATVRSDLYALGAVLHEMLAGHAPFRGSLAEVVMQQQSKEPPPLPSSSGLEKLAARLLEKDPKKRPSSAEEVIEFVDGLGLGEVQPEDIPARPETLDLELNQVVEVNSDRVTGGDGVLASSPADDDASGSEGDAGAELAGAPKEMPPVPETEDLGSRPRGEPLVRTAARALTVVTLLGALAVTGGLFLFAGPSPELLRSLMAKETAATTTLEATAARATPPDSAALVHSALERRGLSLEDVADLPSLAPLAAEWRRAQEDGLREQHSAAARLVIEIERARIDEAVVRRKLQRLETRLAAQDAASPAVVERKQQAAALHEELTADLSEAEYSRLALRIAALEAQAAPAP